MSQASSEGAKLTPMMRQYHEIKAQHRDKLLFYRLGDFYELFFEDAIDAARVLQITLTKRGEVPMAGVPVHAHQHYLQKLLAAGRKVAVVEQTAAEGGKGLFQRQVAQVITPGTLTDPASMEAGGNLWLASWAPARKGRPGALCMLDLSTGEREIHPVGDDAQAVESLFTRFDPRELLVPDDFDGSDPLGVPASRITRLPAWIFEEGYAARRLAEHHPGHAGWGLGDVPGAFSACWAGEHYARENQKTELPHLRPPRIVRRDGRMWVDRATQRNLELVANANDGGEAWSLFALLKQTRSPMGGRFLRRALLEPFSDQAVAKARLDRIDRALACDELEDFRARFATIGDLERVATRIATGRVLPRELASFRDGLKAALELGRDLEVHGLCTRRIDETGLRGALARIDARLLPEPGNDLAEGGILRPECDAILTRLVEARTQGKSWMLAYWEEEKTRTGIPGLKLKFTDASGWFFELSKVQSIKAPEHFVRRQTLVSGDRFVTEKLLQLEAELAEAAEKSVELEKRLYKELLQELLLSLPALQALATVLAEADAELSLAWTAQRHAWCRPELVEDGDLLVEAGRHPVVEEVLGGGFVPNDLALGSEEGRFHLVTGPNMAGKSTYLRQTALIVHLAHMGSRVPAKSARVPRFDRIFTRIGAGDALARGESTFMVEMNETSAILSQATEKSLVILDEVGRGTSTFDGLSIAWALVEFFAREKKGRVLFATHYHELTELDRFPAVANFHLRASTEGGALVFLKRVHPGPADDSYGIQVAAKAGLPKSLLSRAEEILAELESGSFAQKERGKKTETSPAKGKKKKAEEAAPTPHWLEAELLAVDPNRLSPFEALSLIDELRKKVEKGR